MLGEVIVVVISNSSISAVTDLLPHTMPGCFSGLLVRLKPSKKASACQTSETSKTIQPDPSFDILPDPKFCTLEEWQNTSVESPPTYSALKETFNPDAVETIESRIEGLSDELRVLSLKIHGGSPVPIFS